KRLIAAADYQGWQRWVRSSATMREENQGLRFVPTRPTITVYDETGKAVQRFAANRFKDAFWCDLTIDAKELHVSPRHWRSRGLGGQAVVPTDDAGKAHVLQIAGGKMTSHPFIASSDLRTYHPDGKTVVFAEADGVVARGNFDTIWRTDLNKAIPKFPKPW